MAYRDVVSYEAYFLFKNGAYNLYIELDNGKRIQLSGTGSGNGATDPGFGKFISTLALLKCNGVQYDDSNQNFSIALRKASVGIKSVNSNKKNPKKKATKKKVK
ncbi:MAG: hypothetical protein JST46_17710 [Bacteroidetes bacterium]|nr:hypothetical protein [Bacteroidota bacterium]